MTPLASYVLSLALMAAPPGKSSFSLVELPACGSDPEAPTCSVARICEDVKNPACAAPHYEPCFHGFWLNRIGKHEKHTCHKDPGVPAGAWVRLETRDEGATRYEPIAQAIADSAVAHGSEWGGDARDLARAMLAASIWSTGLKEGIETGRVRGPGGETCLADVQIPVLRTAVPPDLARLSDAALADSVAGTDYASLRRCFDAGMALIIRAHKWAEHRCHGWPLDYATFSAYGTGARCDTVGLFGDYAKLRASTYRKFQATSGTVFPSWYTPPEAPAPLANLGTER
jgi:hypothetical protein